MRNAYPNLFQRPGHESKPIERALNRNNGAGGVKGSAANSRRLDFSVQSQLAAGWNRLTGLKSGLAATLGVPDVRLTRQDGQLRVSVHHPGPYPVDLLQLIATMPGYGSHTAVLGLEHDSRPLFLNLLAPEATNILVAGGPGAGKSALLRTLALSLALTNRQSNIQLVIFDGPRDQEQPFSSQLYPLSYLPHMMFPIVESVEAAAETLGFLANEVVYRQEQAVTNPLIVVVIDNVDRLVVDGGTPMQELLVHLLQEGPESGMRLVLAAENPAVPELRLLLVGHTPIRLVGQVADARMARLVTAQPDSQAEYLMGRGDFLAITSGSRVPFQAAYVSDYDLHLSLERLHSQNQRPTIVALPLNLPDQQASSSVMAINLEPSFSGQEQEREELVEADYTIPDAATAAADDLPPYGDQVPAAVEAVGRDDTDDSPLMRVRNEPAPGGDDPKIADRDDAQQPPSWSDAFFDYLNSTDFGQVVMEPATAQLEESATSVQRDDDSAGSVAGEEEWDMFWTDEQYWKEEKNTPSAALAALPAVAEEPAELVYEDIEDELGLAETEEDRHFRNLDEEG